MPSMRRRRSRLMTWRFTTTDARTKLAPLYPTVA